MEQPDTGVDRAAIARRLAAVHARIARAAHAAGRPPDSVRLVAVSKFQPVAAIAAAVDAGQTEFGESRAQELARKLPDAPAGARWHFVGRLQRNKVAQVVGHVDLVHSVDRVSLADAIAKRARQRGLDQRVLVQVDVAGEVRKGGCAVDDLPTLLAHVARSDGVTATGLMTIPPLHADPAPVFADLARLRTRAVVDHDALTELSMGMSADLETAVAHGATIVRVGTAIFGERPVD